jgi:hypothetical protein
MDTFPEGFGLSAATAVVALTADKTRITSRESVRTLNIAALLRRASYQAISDLPRPNPLGEFFINPKKIAAALRRSVVHTELGSKFFELSATQSVHCVYWL